MDQEKSLSTEKKAKKKNTAEQDRIDVLEKRVEQLEYSIRMMAHFNGTNRVLDECKIDRWDPTKKHLKRALTRTAP